MATKTDSETMSSKLEAKLPSIDEWKMVDDNLIVEWAKSPEMTKGGIMMPDTAKQEHSHEGKVLAAGPFQYLPNPHEDGDPPPMDVKAGDYILYWRFAGGKMSTSDPSRHIRMMRRQDITAILKR